MARDRPEHRCAWALPAVTLPRGCRPPTCQAQACPTAAKGALSNIQDLSAGDQYGTLWLQPMINMAWNRKPHSHERVEVSKSFHLTLFWGIFIFTVFDTRMTCGWLADTLSTDPTLTSRSPGAGNPRPRVTCTAARRDAVRVRQAEPDRAWVTRVACPQRPARQWDLDEVSVRVQFQRSRPPRR